MATSSARVLTLLSLLSARERWTGGELAARLAVSERTVRRDVQVLRDLGYGVEAVQGSLGGYRFTARDRLPPLVFDEAQARATAVALQSAPTAITGADEGAARALVALRQVMPPDLRAQTDALDFTAVRNYWEFPAPPIDAEVLRGVGDAIRQRHVLRFRDAVDADASTQRVEPHDLVLWAGRWYVVAFDLDDARWRVLRADRMRPLDPTRHPFTARERPDADLARFVMTTADRGDLLMDWPCQGSAVLALPASLVARYAPGGSVVTAVGERNARIEIGAWSWAGVAGLLLTFDCAIADAEPTELRTALDRAAALAARSG